MDVNAKNLDDFEMWLIENGRDPDSTAAVYRSAVKLCGKASSLTARLVDKSHAPKTRRLELAALRAWADWSDQPELAARLKRIKLPPAVRVAPKVPLELADWRRLVKLLQSSDLASPMRATLLIMALRGLRSGDVLRLKRSEVLAALRTGTLAYEGKGGKRMEFDVVQIRQPLEDLAAITKWDRVRDIVAPGALPKSASRAVRRALHEVAEDLEIEGLHAHRLRRTYATFYLHRIGNDPQALIKLQKHLAWSSLQTAAGYVDATNQKDLDRVGVDLIGDLLK